MKQTIFSAAILIIAAFLVPDRAFAQNTDIEQYIRMNKPLAQNGTIKWSQYYTTLSAVASRSNPAPPPQFAQSADEITSYAIAYEEGKITINDFDAARNQIINKMIRDVSPAPAHSPRQPTQSSTGTDIAHSIMYGLGVYLQGRNQILQMQQQQHAEFVRQQQIYQQQQQYNAGYNCTIYGNQANCVPANPNTPGMIPSR